MKARHLLCLGAILLQGCAEHVYNSGKSSNTTGETEAPVVTNRLRGSIIAGPQAGNARILRKSGIVEAAPGALIELEELKPFPRCGMPLVLSVATLGIIPTHLPDPMRARIVRKGANGRTQTTGYLLKLERRYSLWESLNFSHDDEAVTARALAWAYVENRTMK